MNKIYDSIDQIRYQFQILKLAKKINGQPLTYLDNAATSQKPKIVLDSIVDYYSRLNCNIHRGKYELSQKTSELFDNCRNIIASQINAESNQTIFTSGTTHSLNFIADIYRKTLKRGDVILVSEMEHHSNIIPFQMACKATGADLLPIPITDSGDINMLEYQKLLAKYGKKIKLVSVAHISNVLGTLNMVKKIIDYAHAYEIPVCIDAAQSIAHCKIDVKYLDCDFFVYSGHKAYAPLGIGVLYMKDKFATTIEPYQFGGGMISAVSFAKSEWSTIPERFEAGTQNIEGVIALSVAFEFINKIGIVNIYNYEGKLTDYCVEQLKLIPSVTVIGNPLKRTGIVPFTVTNYKPDEICETLSAYNICVRSGYLCAHPLMKRLNLTDGGVVRISFSVFNTFGEIDKLCQVLKNLKVK
jgi:cysteine desulfurase/selenocysteine lyase